MSVNVKDTSALVDQVRTLKYEYYKEYYGNMLGLPNVAEKIEARFSQHTGAARNIDKIKKLINYDFSNKKVLVVGAGTGAEYFELHRRGAYVFGVEPNEKALEIIHLESSIENIPHANCVNAKVEDLPFDDRSFDCVYCFMVLEHVEDVTKALQEITRVTTKSGVIFLACPDYRQFWEPHYKLHLPMFLPKWIIQCILFLMRRPVGFLKTLRFVNAKMIRKFARNNGLIAMEISQPYYGDYLNPKGGMKCIKWIQDELEIARDQFWILKKCEDQRREG